MRLRHYERTALRPDLGASFLSWLNLDRQRVVYVIINLKNMRPSTPQAKNFSVDQRPKLRASNLDSKRKRLQNRDHFQPKTFESDVTLVFLTQSQGQLNGWYFLEKKIGLKKTEVRFMMDKCYCSGNWRFLLLNRKIRVIGSWLVDTRV